MRRRRGSVAIDTVPMPDRPRGSTRLSLARRLSKRDLARIINVTKGRGIKVIDWHIVGQPAPEMVTGAVHVKAAVAPTVLGRLVRLRSGNLRPRLDVFPVGIPVPDMFTIRFRF